MAEPQRTRPCGGCFVCAGRIVADLEDLTCSNPIPIDEHGRDITLEDELRQEVAQLREAVADLNDLIAQERAVHEQTIRRAEQAEAANVRVRALHSETPHRPGYCYCANPCPCRTIQALDGQGPNRG